MVASEGKTSEAIMRITGKVLHIRGEIAEMIADTLRTQTELRELRGNADANESGAINVNIGTLSKVIGSLAAISDSFDSVFEDDSGESS